MPPTSDLNPVARVLESLLVRAWCLSDELKYDEAYHICNKLLLEQRIGRLHRAGFHLMLGQSSNDYVWHADEAVRMYENMYSDETPTPEQAEGIKELLEIAKTVQEKAHADQTAFEENTPTEEEERVWTEQQLIAAEEQRRKFLNDESDSGDDGPRVGNAELDAEESELDEGYEPEEADDDDEDDELPDETEPKAKMV